MILIRKAKEKDEGAINEILFKCGLNNFDTNIYLDNAMVVEVEDLIVGFGCMEICNSEAFLKLVCILPEYQNQGLGDGLVRALINYADRRDIKKMYIFDCKNLSYFKGFGFKEIEFDKMQNDLVLNNQNSKSEPKSFLELDIQEFFNRQKCH